MLADQPLLTIAIPTYSRKEFLAQLLLVLAPQLENETRVELLISDNASTDETPELIRSFRDGGLVCRYIRNDTNIGSDANFLQCFKEAAGRYVWLVGDDDIIPAGAIRRILSLLEVSEFDLVYLRPVEFRSDPMKEYKPDPRGRHALRIGSASRFARLVGNMFTLTTCNIINKNRLRGFVQVLDESLLSSNLIQLAWTYPLLLHFNSGLYVFDRLISVRASNRAGYSISRVFGANFKQITDLLLCSRPELARIMHGNVVSKCLPFLVLEVRQGRFGDFVPEDFHAALKLTYGHLLPYWFYVFPIAVCPVWFAEIWLRVIQRINSIWPATQLLMYWANPREKVSC